MIHYLLVHVWTEMPEESSTIGRGRGGAQGVVSLRGGAPPVASGSASGGRAAYPANAPRSRRLTYRPSPTTTWSSIIRTVQELGAYRHVNTTIALDPSAEPRPHAGRSPAYRLFGPQGDQEAPSAARPPANPLQELRP